MNSSLFLFILLKMFIKKKKKKKERNKLKVMGTEKWSRVGNFIIKICVM